MNIFFCVEGLSGAGKSLLLSQLKKHYKLTIIPEIPLKERSSKGGNPPFTTNEQSAKKANQWFMTKELERDKRARVLLKDSSVGMERSFISQLAYCYARDQIYGTNILPSLTSKYQSLLDSKKLLCPFVIYVEIPLSTASSRIIKRENITGHLDPMKHYSEFTSEFLSKIVEYYKLLLKANRKSMIKINGVNSPQESVALLLPKLSSFELSTPPLLKLPQKPYK